MAPLNDARQRIASAFDPEKFGELATEWTGTLQDHLTRVLDAQGPVIPWRPPRENVADAAGRLQGTAEFGDLIRQMLERGHNLHHPHYLGHQVPPPVPIAGLFDAIGAVTNQVMAIYEMGPWATAVEMALVEEIGMRIGWERQAFSGLITHGGSLANLTALLTARNVSLGGAWEKGVSGDPVILVHEDAHYSVVRSAGVLGIGTKNVIRVPLDDKRRIRPDSLDEILAGLRKRQVPIVAVSACACATPIGAFDPLPRIAEVCRKHEVWLHVDAAHGGATLFSEKHRHLVKGLELADSVVLDAHKMLFVSGLCAFVFYRNRAHGYETFQQDAPYLFDPTDPGLAEFDQGIRTVECTKRAAGFGLWGLWSMFGPQLFADLVDVTFHNARELYEMLKNADDFQPLHEPECNILTFRYVPEKLRQTAPDQLGEFQMKLRRRVIESGDFYIVSTKLDGIGALRTVLMNPLTTSADLTALLDILRCAGSDILNT